MSFEHSTLKWQLMEWDSYWPSCWLFSSCPSYSLFFPSFLPFLEFNWTFVIIPFYFLSWHTITESRVWLLTAQNLIKGLVSWKAKFALFWMLTARVKGRTDVCPKAEPSTNNQGARAFIDGWRGLHAERPLSALTVILKLVISCLISIDCFRYNLSFKNQFVSIFLKPVLGIVAAYVRAIVWSSRS